MNSPDVSVIIPAYNAENFISKAVDSILQQEYQGKVEIIIIDDKSSDRTRDVVQRLQSANKDRDIKLLENNRKKGPSGARNTGLLSAKGNFIAFLDADDLWFPNHLSEGLSFLDKTPEVDVVLLNCSVQEEYKGKNISDDWFSRRKIINSLKTRDAGDGFKIIQHDLFEALLTESFMHLQAMIMRRKCVEEIIFNESISRSEDRDLCIRIYKDFGATFALKNVITGLYYRHAGSITSYSTENTLKGVLDNIIIFEKYISETPDSKKITKILKDLLLDRYLTASYCQRNLNLHREAMNSVVKSLPHGVTAKQAREVLKIAASALFRVLKKAA